MISNNKENEMMAWVNKALYYEKNKDIINCNYCCEQAIKLGHFGIYPYQKAIINYVKLKDWENALRICDKVFENERFFEHRNKPSTWETISTYAEKRKEYILKQIEK